VTYYLNINQIRAFNLYQSLEGDYQLREQVHHRYISDEPFVDRGPDRAWRDDEEDLALENLEDSPQISHSEELVQLNANEYITEPEKIEIQCLPEIMEKCM
jgi:hypothetical protein